MRRRPPGGGPLLRIARVLRIVCAAELRASTVHCAVWGEAVNATLHNERHPSRARRRASGLLAGRGEGLLEVVSVPGGCCSAVGRNEAVEGVLRQGEIRRHKVGKARDVAQRIDMDTSTKE